MHMPSGCQDEGVSTQRARGLLAARAARVASFHCCRTMPATISNSVVFEIDETCSRNSAGALFYRSDVRFWAVQRHARLSAALVHDRQQKARAVDPTGAAASAGFRHDNST